MLFREVFHLDSEGEILGYSEMYNQLKLADFGVSEEWTNGG